MLLVSVFCILPYLILVESDKWDFSPPLKRLTTYSWENPYACARGKSNINHLTSWHILVWTWTFLVQKADFFLKYIIAMIGEDFSFSRKKIGRMRKNNTTFYYHCIVFSHSYHFKLFIPSVFIVTTDRATKTVFFGKFLFILHNHIYRLLTFTTFHIFYISIIYFHNNISYL